jgi:hypothetical protein
MAEKFFQQNNWNGGLSDSELVGMKGSLAEAVGLDIRSKPGIITPSQALVKESGTTVTDFCKFGLVATDGNAYFFGDTGKIYKRTAAGVWSNVYIDANGAILGCAEWNGYIYWATSTKLGRQSTTLAASEASWASQNNAWQTLNSATYHPMTVQGLYLLIGNNTEIATVDELDNFTANGTPDVILASLPSEHTITTIGNFGIDVLVGTKVTINHSFALICRWDMASPAYISMEEIPENGINGFIPTDNFMFIQAGTQGRIYYYDGSTLKKKRKINGDYANKTMTMYPDSYCSFRGVACFGISNLSNDPCLEGVYTYSQYDADYPLALMLEYVISTNHLSKVEIGTLVAIGNNLLVAWKDSTSGTSYGVDNISWSTKYSGAYFKTLQIGGDRKKKKTFQEYVISYRSKPTGTGISLSYYPNYNSSPTTITLNNQSNYYKMYGRQKFEAGTAQFKVNFTVNGNNAPEVEEIYIQFNEQEIL